MGAEIDDSIYNLSSGGLSWFSVWTLCGVDCSKASDGGMKAMAQRREGRVCGLEKVFKTGSHTGNPVAVEQEGTEATERTRKRSMPLRARYEQRACGAHDRLRKRSPYGTFTARNKRRD